MTPKKLMLAALDRKSVIGSNHLGCGHRPTPAAWIQNMPFVQVMGHLHELKIHKTHKKKTLWRKPTWFRLIAPREEPAVVKSKPEMEQQPK